MYQIISNCINIRDIKLEYELQKEPLINGSVSYSIQVRKGEETATLVDVSTSYQAARELFDMLVRGSVTPITAFDILEDWLLR